MIAADMDIQIGLGTTDNHGIVEWTYPHPFTSAPLVLGTPRDPAIEGYNVNIGNDDMAAIVVVQLATHVKAVAQVFTLTSGPLTGNAGTIRIAKAGVDVNFIALWPITHP